VHLLMESSDEIGLPDDPEFRSAFVAYIEWGTRIAVLNSNVADVAMNPGEPMPKWGWGVPGKPFQGGK
jgi:hemoglobin